MLFVIVVVEVTVGRVVIISMIIMKPDYFSASSDTLSLAFGSSSDRICCRL